jgi:hypothetical protein
VRTREKRTSPKGKKGKSNKKAMRAALDRIKAEILDHTKQTNALNQQAQDLLSEDTSASTQIG